MVVGMVVIFLLRSAPYVRKVNPRRQVRHLEVNQDQWMPLFGTPVNDWYRTWAWKPVFTIDRGYIWMRPYWRRRVHKHQYLHGGSDFWWQNVVKVQYIRE